MEANEIQEFVEEQEKGRESHLYPVSFSISVLAVLVALVTVMSHRSHTAAILAQARSTDEWGLYQAKKVRQNEINLASDLLAVVAPTDATALKDRAAYKAHTAKWDNDLKDSEERARKLEEEVERAEHKASRFDAGEALLQIAVVLSSITLLTRQRVYWLLGLAIGVVGLGFALTGYLLH
jgi:hypothetical protein